MNIKALAYGALTSLNPVHGLYTSFYTGLVYVLFGTSKHLSVGTFAVTSLMVYSTVYKLEQQHLMRINNDEQNISILNDMSNQTGSFETGLSIENHDIKVKIATALAFWCGIFQVIL
jgi:MFS superfamily sulfate permease-like transporter